MQDMAQEKGIVYNPVLSEGQRAENIELSQWLPGRIEKLEQASVLLGAMCRKHDIIIDIPGLPGH